jgi:hypothetical protein
MCEGCGVVGVLPHETCTKLKNRPFPKWELEWLGLFSKGTWFMWFFDVKSSGL